MKGCEYFSSKIKNIINHIWYCACYCRGNPDVQGEMLRSLEHHICNKHDFTGTFSKYTKYCQTFYREIQIRKQGI